MQLTRKRIITAAMDLIESDGAEAISMHRLATHLGCGLVSVYSYLPSMSALLDAVADTMMSGIGLPPVGTGGWQEQMRALAQAFREIARARPRCAMLVVTRPPSAAMLRPVEHALATLREAGFHGPDALRVVRAVVTYVIGSVVGEIGVSTGLDAGDDELRRLRLRPGQFPHLTALAGEPTASNPDADFEFGLDLLVRSIEAMQPTRAVAS